MHFAESPTSNYWSTRGSVLLSTLLMTRSLISHGYHIYGFAAAQLRWLGSINHFQYMTWPLNTSWWVTSQKVTTRQTSVWERNIKKPRSPRKLTIMQKIFSTGTDTFPTNTRVLRLSRSRLCRCLINQRLLRAALQTLFWLFPLGHRPCAIPELNLVAYSKHSFISLSHLRFPHCPTGGDA